MLLRPGISQVCLHSHSKTIIADKVRFADHRRRENTLLINVYRFDSGNFRQYSNHSNKEYLSHSQAIINNNLWTKQTYRYDTDNIVIVSIAVHIIIDSNISPCRGDKKSKIAFVVAFSRRSRSHCPKYSFRRDCFSLSADCNNPAWLPAADGYSGACFTQPATFSDIADYSLIIEPLIVLRSNRIRQSNFMIQPEIVHDGLMNPGTNSDGKIRRLLTYYYNPDLRNYNSP